MWYFVLCCVAFRYGEWQLFTLCIVYENREKIPIKMNWCDSKRISSFRKLQFAFCFFVRCGTKWIIGVEFFFLKKKKKTPILLQTLFNLYSFFNFPIIRFRIWSSQTNLNENYFELYGSWCWCGYYVSKFET